MTARPKNGGWMADFTAAGNRYREFGFASELEAVAWEAQARVSLAKGHALPPGPTSTKTKKVSIGDHVRHCARNHWSGHKAPEKSVRNAELFAEFVGSTVPVAEALTTQAILEYVEDLKERENSGGTINRKLAALSVLVKHAKALDMITKDPLLPWQREGQGRLRFFTREEADALFRTLEQWGRVRERDLFVFLLDTGCRLGEALKLEGSDVGGVTRAMATFNDTKNGDNRTIPLTHRAFEAFSRTDFTVLNPHTLRSLWERLRTHHEWIGTASIHTFRHTCASWLVQRGVDLYRVQKWMGHKSITTTQRYAHLAPKHLEDVVGALEG